LPEFGPGPVEMGNSLKIKEIERSKMPVDALLMGCLLSMIFPGTETRHSGFSEITHCFGS
jgi:hypothetical protein